MTQPSRPNQHIVCLQPYALLDIRHSKTFFRSSIRGDTRGMHKAAYGRGMKIRAGYEGTFQSTIHIRSAIIRVILGYLSLHRKSGTCPLNEMLNEKTNADNWTCTKNLNVRVLRLNIGQGHNKPLVCIPRIDFLKLTPHSECSKDGEKNQALEGTTPWAFEAELSRKDFGPLQAVNSDAWIWWSLYSRSHRHPMKQMIIYIDSRISGLGSRK